MRDALRHALEVGTSHLSKRSALVAELELRNVEIKNAKLKKALAKIELTHKWLESHVQAGPL